MKKKHVNAELKVELKIPLFLKEINDTKLVKGQGYYFEIPQSVYHNKKMMYYGTFVGGRTFTDTYSIVPETDNSYETPYHGTVEANHKIYDVDVDVRSKHHTILPVEMLRGISKYLGPGTVPSLNQKTQSEASYKPSHNYFEAQPSYSPPASPPVSPHASPTSH
jgi:hypothetical protein